MHDRDGRSDGPGLEQGLLNNSTERKKEHRTGQNRAGQGRAALHRSVCLMRAGLVRPKRHIHAHACIIAVRIAMTAGGKTAGEGRDAGADSD